jgi:competence protein ComEA
VLVKAAGITCGMLALAAIGALATARGLGGQRIALAEPSASSSALPDRALQAPSAAALHVRPGSLEAGMGGPGSAPRSPSLSHGASAAPSPSAAPVATPSEGLTADGKVILNRANLEELGRLPGVGPKRAQAILDLRAKLGRFRRPTDLLRVKGIGPKSLKKLEPHFVLDPPPVPAS